MTTGTIDHLTQREPMSITISDAEVATRSAAGRSRAIGAAGTVARILLGGYLVGSVIEAEITDGFTPLLWALGLLAFPGVLLAAQWVRARRGAGRLDATGPFAHPITLAGFMALTLIPEYNRAIDVTGDAAVVFVGASMLLAAARGYAGCEVLAISNWLLRRDDQLGCIVFAPVDLAESQLRRKS
jgi:hypothetical protein